jgi:hypothetical protein
MSDKETSLAFVERMELLWNQHNEQLPFSDDCFSRFSDLARTAALIEEHQDECCADAKPNSRRFFNDDWRQRNCRRPPRSSPSRGRQDKGASMSNETPRPIMGKGYLEEWAEYLASN